MSMDDHVQAAPHYASGRTGTESLGWSPLDDHDDHVADDDDEADATQGK